MAKRKTIAENPLDQGPLGTVIPAQRSPKRREKVAKTGGTKAYAFHLPGDLLEGLRDAVYSERDLTMSGVAKEALRRALTKLQKERNGGEPFPSRKGDLKPGRRIAR